MNLDIHPSSRGHALVDADSGELMYEIDGDQEAARAAALLALFQSAHVYFDTWALGEALDIYEVKVCYSSRPMVFNPARHFTADYRCGYFAGLEVPA